MSFAQLSARSSGTERCSRRENSNLIQITSRDTSIWRGKLWSTITFKIKVDNYFVTNAPDGAPYTLRPMIVDARTNEMYDPSCGMVKLTFEKNTPTSSAVATVTRDPHNTIEAEFHQDLFEHGDTFYLVVEAHGNDNEVIFGRSPMILATNLSLSIEECFVQNQWVDRIKDNNFSWYSKCGGDKAGLSVTFHLKDEKGSVVNPSNIPMKLKTELVYDDGSPTPHMPMAPLKARRSSDLSRNPLYRRLAKDPVLQPGQGSHPFSFRIEEVSFHHPGHEGFKLKVSPADPQQHFVHPGLLEETIVVLSKPKHDASKTKKRGGRSSTQSTALSKKRGGRSNTVLSDLDDEEDLAPKPTKIRKVSNVSIDATDNVRQVSAHVTVPSIGLLNFARSHDGKCVFCQKEIAATVFLSLGSHTNTCPFAVNILPPTRMVASQSNTKVQARSLPQPKRHPNRQPKRKPKRKPQPQRDVDFNFGATIHNDHAMVPTNPAANRATESESVEDHRRVSSFCASGVEFLQRPGATPVPMIDLTRFPQQVLPPQHFPPLRAGNAGNAFARQAGKHHGSPPAFDQPQVQSGAYVRGFPSTAWNHTISNGPNDDGGISALADGPLDSRDAEEYHSAVEDHRISHQESV